MTIEFRKSGVLLTNRVEFPIFGNDGGIGALQTAADNGALGAGLVVIDDPDGDLTVEGWETFTVDDTSATPTRVWTGLITEHKGARGQKYMTGSARVHVCDLYDENAYLHLHVLRVNAAKRGPETDVARIQYILTSEALSGLVFDEGLVGTASPINLLEQDMRRTFADDAIRTFSPVAGKNFYAYHGTAGPALVYQADSATYWAASLGISNDDADIGTAIYPPFADAEMNHEPNDQYGGVSFGWKGDPIYAQSATTIAAMGLLRDSVVDFDRIGLLATAQSEAARYLNIHASEQDTAVVTLRVPSTAVNYVFAGQEIEVKLVHIDGYANYVTGRVRRRDVRPLSPIGPWDMRLEIWFPRTPGDDAATPECTEIVQVASGRTLTIVDNTITFAQATVPGHLLLAYISRRDASVGLQAGWTHLSNEVNATGDKGRWQYRFADGSTSYIFERDDGYSNTNITVWEISGLDGFVPATHATLYETTDGASSTTLNLSSVTSPSSGQTILAGWTYDTGFNPNQDATMGSGMVKDYNDGWDDAFADEHPWHLAAHWNGTTTPLTPSCTIPNAAAYGGVIVQLAGECDDEPLPYIGDPVGPETPTGAVDGSNTSFAAVGGWIPGTLTVLHDGTDQTAHVTTEDPVAGTAVLDYAPSTGSTIRFRYTSR